MNKTDKTNNSFSWFRKIAFAEGVSFIVLLLIAMPLKYFAGLPIAVTIIGSAHGLLFVAFLVLSWDVKTQFKMSWNWMTRAFVASIIPFGTFYMDKFWKKEQEELELKQAT
jgi:integral membrane protein